MSESETKPDLKQLIEDAQQGVVQQQASAAAHANQAPARSIIRTLLAYSLLTGFIVIALLQYPRFQAPYAWPDAVASPTAAEADLEAVVGVVETFRAAQGQYPSSLSQLQFPEGLAQQISGSSLVYAPLDTGYTLTWTLPRWVASYSSASGKISVEATSKN